MFQSDNVTFTIWNTYNWGQIIDLHMVGFLSTYSKWHVGGRKVANVQIWICVCKIIQLYCDILQCYQIYLPNTCIYDIFTSGDCVIIERQQHGTLHIFPCVLHNQLCNVSKTVVRIATAVESPTKPCKTTAKEHNFHIIERLKNGMCVYKKRCMCDIEGCECVKYAYTMYYIRSTHGFVALFCCEYITVLVGSSRPSCRWVSARKYVTPLLPHWSYANPSIWLTRCQCSDSEWFW